MLLTLEITKLRQVKIKSLKAYKHPECTHSSTGKTVFFGLFLDTIRKIMGLAQGLSFHIQILQTQSTIISQIQI